MAGKGSRPRPFSVDMKTFDSNWDAIFKKDNMTPKVENMKKGTCGCGRSPTGDCIGWHSLSEEVYQHQKMLWIEEQLKKDQELDEYKKQAQQLWSDSCTSGRSEV